ncbi:MAG: tellurite resistance TerB family protein [Beijerinckiaceae bacterium]
MDATKILEQLLAGAGGQQNQAGGGLGGLLGGLASSLGGAQGQQGAGQQGGAQQGGGLGGLLGGLLGGQQNQAGQAPQGGGGGLGGLLGGLASSLGGQAGSAGGAAAGGISDILGKLNGMGGGTGGLAVGGLLAMMLGGKGGLGTLAKMGGLAALGMLAHRALQNYQASQKGSPAPAAAQLADVPDHRQQLAAPASDGQPFALSLIRAMISAANADGVITDDEKQVINAQLGTMELDEEGRAFVQNAVENPATAAQIAALADGPEQGVQLYLMSRLAINPDEESEKAYLAQLAESLGLDADLVAHLEQQVQQAQAA